MILAKSSPPPLIRQIKQQNKTIPPTPHAANLLLRHMHEALSRPAPFLHQIENKFFKLPPSTAWSLRR
ncbi:hypothetical protein K402DRAFT_171793 [Aulographum hederae CBS 113979]|uniref:Uncharacterized protein n=1 Tax=Aulographum hederae CBS 113979 TaxID=1176131 RepID=A0A6G1HD29_9PEZI|nr:hypothetical protein K402DRAFT_171793 [Aulographum hederae CBS 113979]